MAEEESANDLLCLLDHSLESLHISQIALGEPHGNAVGQDAVKGRILEDHQQLLINVNFPKHSQEMQTLLCYS